MLLTNGGYKRIEQAQKSQEAGCCMWSVWKAFKTVRTTWNCMLRCWGCVGSEWITSCFPKLVRKQMAYVFGSSKKAGIWATENWGIRKKEMKKLFIFSAKYFPSLLCITIKSEPHRNFFLFLYLQAEASICSWWEHTDDETLSQCYANFSFCLSAFSLKISVLESQC